MTNPEELYQEIILDHYKNPRCEGDIENPSSKMTMLNPLCGDAITVTLSTDGDMVKEVNFIGDGCAISKASASMMSEICCGKTKSEILDLESKFNSLLKGEVDATTLPELGDAASLGGVRHFSARIRCALLAWEAIKKALDKID